ncbi:uncharacterized protein BDZ99DRAFT_475215 [Mytilinidion resinicola]|uniref:Uncharacterized protein n=1 Tax=Mytilinidion resinicola TaxID=574789 RepID=A0A6A6YSD5_9PEZI|nr:uncharacterized protein BDZ99DRAFT_475215 [Mytilinidion resinicola]KAF2811691.1 hypothetical protein BDZ99DRAFT_475215 [Mytilinidion resinicola]
MSAHPRTRSLHPGQGCKMAIGFQKVGWSGRRRRVVRSCASLVCCERPPCRITRDRTLACLAWFPQFATAEVSSPIVRVAGHQALTPSPPSILGLLGPQDLGLCCAGAASRELATLATGLPALSLSSRILNPVMGAAPCKMLFLPHAPRCCIARRLCAGDCASCCDAETRDAENKSTPLCPWKR